MNRNKLSLEISGLPMLQHVVNTAKKAHFHEIILVHSKTTQLPEGNLRFVLNEEPQLGISRSISLGVEAADPSAEGFVFLMGDQPFLTVETLKQIKHRFVKNAMRIVVPVFNGKKGSPVFFPAFLKGEFLKLTGDLGGRQIMDHHDELIVYETISSETEGQDIDTKEEYAAHSPGLTVLVRGAGDLATGVIHTLYRRGFKVIVTETDNPSCIRTEVAFASCVHEGRKAVEGVTAVHILSADDIEDALSKDLVPVLIDPDLKSLKTVRPDVLIDAVIAKRNTGLSKDLAPLVIALGPGFTAGEDCHLVIETMRGPDLGRIISKGSALPNTGVPGMIENEAEKRVIHSPADGKLRRMKRPGDLVEEGDIIALVDDVPVYSKLKGTLRGLIYNEFEVTKGLKIADVDPRLDPALATTISDKANRLGQAVVRAIRLVQKRQAKDR